MTTVSWALHAGWKPALLSGRTIAYAANPTFDEVVRACNLLKQFRIQFNTLTVVNRLNAKFPVEVYDFLVNDLGSWRIQFLPCVEPKDFCSTAPQHWGVAKLPIVGSPGARPGNPESVVTEWSVNADDWGEFMCRVFDRWYERDVGRIVVNWFESIVAQLMGDPALMCVLAEVCGRALAMERDGSVYSCDHYVYPEFKLGNIREHDLSAMVYSATQRRFGCNKRDTLPQYCRRCEHRTLCNGECPKNRFIKTPDGEAGLNYLCPGLMQFFSHITPRLRLLAQRLRDFNGIGIASAR